MVSNLGGGVHCSVRKYGRGAMDRSTETSIADADDGADVHASTRALLHDAAQRAASYLESIGQRPVVPSAAAVAALLRLDGPLPAQGMDAQQTLAMLDELVSPATMAMAGPRFFGFVIGGSLPAALAANWLAAAWDQNCAFNSITPGVARLEESALRRLVALFELPPLEQTP